MSLKTTTAGGRSVKYRSTVRGALEQRLSHDSEVVRWTYYPAGLDEAGARERIEAALERAASGISRRYDIRDERGEPLGTCGLGRLQTVPDVFYAVLPEHRRRGSQPQP